MLDERYAYFSFCVSHFISAAKLCLCDLHYIYEWFCEKKQCVTMKTGKCQLKNMRQYGVFTHYKQLCKFIRKCKRLDKKGFQPPRDWYLDTKMA